MIVGAMATNGGPSNAHPTVDEERAMQGRLRAAWQVEGCGWNSEATRGAQEGTERAENKYSAAWSVVQEVAVCAVEQAVLLRARLPHRGACRCC